MTGPGRRFFEARRRFDRAIDRDLGEVARVERAPFEALEHVGEADRETTALAREFVQHVVAFSGDPLRGVHDGVRFLDVARVQAVEGVREGGRGRRGHPVEFGDQAGRCPFLPEDGHRFRDPHGVVRDPLEHAGREQVRRAFRQGEVEGHEDPGVAERARDLLLEEPMETVDLPVAFDDVLRDRDVARAERGHRVGLHRADHLVHSADDRRDRERVLADDVLEDDRFGRLLEDLGADHPLRKVPDHLAGPGVHPGRGPDLEERVSRRCTLR